MFMKSKIMLLVFGFTSVVFTKGSEIVIEAEEPQTFQVICHINRLMEDDLCTVKYDTDNNQVGVMIKAKCTPSIIQENGNTCINMECDQENSGLFGSRTQPQNHLLCLPSPSSTEDSNYANETNDQESVTQKSVEETVEETIEETGEETFEEPTENSTESEHTEVENETQEVSSVQTETQDEHQTENDEYEDFVSGTESSVQVTGIVEEPRETTDGGISGVQESETQSMNMLKPKSSSRTPPTSPQSSSIQTSADSPKTASPMVLNSPIIVASPQNTSSLKLSKQEILASPKLATPPVSPKIATPAVSPKIATPPVSPKIATPPVSPKIADSPENVAVQSLPASPIQLPKALENTPLSLSGSPIQQSTPAAAQSPMKGAEESHGPILAFSDLAENEELAVVKADSVKVTDQEIVVDSGMKAAIASQKSRITNLFANPSVTQVKVVLIFEAGIWNAVVDRI